MARATIAILADSDLQWPAVAADVNRRISAAIDVRFHVGGYSGLYSTALAKNHLYRSLILAIRNRRLWLEHSTVNDFAAGGCE